MTDTTAFERACAYELRAAARDLARDNWLWGQIAQDGFAALGRKPPKDWEEALDQRLPLPTTNDCS